MRAQRSLAGLVNTAKNVLTNPVVAAILIGTAWGFTGIPLPRFVDDTLALVAGGDPVVADRTRHEPGRAWGAGAWRESVAMTALKLVAHPAAVYAIARLLALPALETQTVVMLATLPVGANVYLMSREFGTLEARSPRASCCRPRLPP